MLCCCWICWIYVSSINWQCFHYEDDDADNKEDGNDHDDDDEDGDSDSDDGAIHTIEKRDQSIGNDWDFNCYPVEPWLIAIQLHWRR